MHWAQLYVGNGELLCGPMLHVVAATLPTTAVVRFHTKQSYWPSSTQLIYQVHTVHVFLLLQYDYSSKQCLTRSAAGSTQPNTVR
jgi:hypothetical protein